MTSYHDQGCRHKNGWNVKKCFSLKQNQRQNQFIEKLSVSDFWIYFLKIIERGRSRRSRIFNNDDIENVFYFNIAFFGANIIRINISKIKYNISIKYKNLQRLSFIIYISALCLLPLVFLPVNRYNCTLVCTFSNGSPIVTFLMRINKFWE